MRFSKVFVLCTIMSTSLTSMENPSQGLAEFYLPESTSFQAVNGPYIEDSLSKAISGGKDVLENQFSIAQEVTNAWSTGKYKDLAIKKVDQCLQDYYSRLYKKYVSTHDPKNPSQDFDMETLRPFVRDLREEMFRLIHPKAAFGRKKIFFDPESGRNKTYYEIHTPSTGALIDKLVPEDVPLKGVIRALVDTDLVNGYILGKLDDMAVKYFFALHKLATGNDEPEATTKKRAVSGLTSNLALIKADYKKCSDLPVLTQEESEKYSHLWTYLEPKMNHYMRVSFTNQALSLSDTIIDEGTETLVTSLTRNPAFQFGTMTTICATLDWVLPTPSFINYPLGFLAASSLMPAISQAMKGAGQGAGEHAKDLLKLHVAFAGFRFLPYSEAEHVLFGLNPSPTPLELALFRTDYQRQAELNRHSLLSEFAKDVISQTKSIKTVLSKVLETASTAIKQFVHFCLHSKSISGSLMHDIILNKKNNHPFPQISSTIAQIQQLQLMAKMGRNERAKADFDLRATLWERLCNYFQNQIPLEELSSEERTFLNNVKKFPSYALKKQELEYLSYYVTARGAENKERLKQFLAQMKSTRQERINQATQFVEDLNRAPENFSNFIKVPEDDSNSWATRLGAQHDYKHAIEFLQSTLSLAEIMDILAGTLSTESLTTFLKAHNSILEVYFAQNSELNITHLAELLKSMPQFLDKGLPNPKKLTTPYDPLKSEDFAVLKQKYSEMVASTNSEDPEDFELFYLNQVIGEQDSEGVLSGPIATLGEEDLQRVMHRMEEDRLSRVANLEDREFILGNRAEIARFKAENKSTAGLLVYDYTSLINEMKTKQAEK